MDAPSRSRLVFLSVFFFWVYDHFLHHLPIQRACLTLLITALLLASGNMDATWMVVFSALFLYKIRALSIRRQIMGGHTDTHFHSFFTIFQPSTISFSWFLIQVRKWFTWLLRVSIHSNTNTLLQYTFFFFSFRCYVSRVCGHCPRFMFIKLLFTNFKLFPLFNSYSRAKLGFLATSD